MLSRIIQLEVIVILGGVIAGGYFYLTRPPLPMRGYPRDV